MWGKIFSRIRFSFVLSFMIVFCSVFGNNRAYSQQKHKLTMTLEEVTETAKEQSQAAMLAKHNFLINYWQFRSYKATLLPSLNLNASLGQYNRSLMALRNSETGEYNYVSNNNLTNSLSLSIDQNVALTGGRVSLITSLNRLDQFSPINNVLYNSQPVKINYSQPIKAYNALKWDKIVEPKHYERAKRNYMETMEQINISAVNLFFNVLSARINLEMAQKDLESSDLSLKIAQERYEIGTVTKNDVLSLNHRFLNAQLDISDKQLALEMSMLNLRTFLGFNDNVDIELVIPESIPDLQIDYQEVYSRSIENTAYMLGNEISLLNAEQEVARAKSTSGLQANFFAIFGLTQRGDSFSGAYKNPMDQEILGISLSLPILDWGMGKGKVKLAQSREEVVKTQVEQSIAEYRQNILIKVMQFNKLNVQCNISLQADSIAKLSYDIANERFKNGTITVLELNTAQNNMRSSASRYINDLGDFWQNYFTIRKLSLYDYIKGKEVTLNLDKLTDN